MKDADVLVNGFLCAEVREWMWPDKNGNCAVKRLEVELRDKNLTLPSSGVYSVQFPRDGELIAERYRGSVSRNPSPGFYEITVEPEVLLDKA